jgi:trk system potassium uptake protein TrkA
LARHSPLVVVIGLGRMGMALALALARRDVEVLAIDRDPDVVQALSAALPRVVQGDTTDRELLTQLGVDRADRAVVAIGEELEASILTVSLLAELAVPHIWAKAISEQHARILLRMGATEVVRPEHEAGERLSHLVVGTMKDFLVVDEDYAFVKVTAPTSLVDQSLEQTGLRRRFGVTIVATRAILRPWLRQVTYPDILVVV